MALTLTITSFTCTFPVVGGLLVMAAGGQFFYPILGMATFATVLALPFFLLALAPGLLSRMPKSGDWMNAVKVVGGLVEIGAALKFLNTAELSYVTPENAFFDAQLVLSAWVALAVVCGLYLLGIFRTDHDHEEVKIGPGRLVGGTLFLGLALFFAPALFGRPPQSQVWFLVAGILPPDAAELNAPVPVAGGGGGGAVAHETKAQSPDPETAEREQKNFHGVAWGMSLEAARERCQGREQADPHRLHGGQLRQLPDDGAERPAPARGRRTARQVHHGPALHRLRPDQLHQRGPAPGPGREESGSAPRHHR